jgi:hypothetical protein
MEIEGTSWFKIWVLPQAAAAVKLECLKRIIFDRFGTMGLKATQKILSSNYHLSIPWATDAGSKTQNISFNVTTKENHCEGEGLLSAAQPLVLVNLPRKSSISDTVSSAFICSTTPPIDRC